LGLPFLFFAVYAVITLPKKEEEEGEEDSKMECLSFCLVIAQLFFWWWCCAGVKSCQVDSGYWLLSLLFLVLFCLFKF